MSRAVARVSAGLLAVCTWSAAAPAEKVPAAQAFGAREAVRGAALSPSGSRMAYIAPGAGRGNALYVVDTAGTAAPRRVLAASGAPERLSGCGWVSDARLVCTIYVVRAAAGETMGLSRMIAVDHDGSNLKLVTRRQSDNATYLNTFGGRVIDWLPGQQGAVLVGRTYVPEGKVGSLVNSRHEGYGVDRIDTATLASKRVVAPQRDAVEYLSDGQGNVRMMGVAVTKSNGYMTGELKYHYRDAPGGAWQPFGDYNIQTRAGFNPYAIDSAENVVYGFRQQDGRQALFKRALDGSRREVLVYSRPDVDIDDLIQLGRKQRVVGLTYANEKRQARYFDPALDKLRASLAKVLPNTPLVTFEGASEDEQKLLIWAGSDIDPGRYYLFDRTSKQLRPLLLSRPELADYQLAPVKPVNVVASDGTPVPAYLTLPPGSTGKGLPAIVMPHGGPSARDEWGFDWLAQYFAHRGYAVLQPNYRGSSGYGDSWFKNNGFQSWKVAIGDVIDSGRWLVSQGIAKPDALAIAGWSYGGYAALQAGAVAPDLFKAIVAVAPVTDLAALKEQSRYSSDHVIARDFIGSGPHLREGSPAQNAAAIKAPVLLFHGDHDLNVDVSASRLMADKLRGAGKNPQMVIYKGLDHQLDDSAARAELLSKTDSFIRAAIGM